MGIDRQDSTARILDFDDPVLRQRSLIGAPPLLDIDVESEFSIFGQMQRQGHPVTAVRLAGTD